MHLDANQLKLFQQLTQTVNSEVTAPPIHSFLPPPPPAPTSETEFVAGPSNPPAYWNNLRNAPDKPWDAGQVTSSVEENNYHGHRGRFRGGYRSRGRGRYGDRDRDGQRDRFYDTARSPPGHGRSSRSRSPSRSRYGGAGRRDIVKPYSPPHRPSLTDQPDLDADTLSSQHPGVDEFGREIRPCSDDDRSQTPDDFKSRPAPPPPAAHTHAHLSPTSALEVEGTLVSGEQESSAISTPQAAASATEALHQDTGELGLQSFDYSSFDPTLPSSWEALGNAWAATNGRQPLQEELMMFVMEFTVSMASQALPSGPAAQANQWTGQGQRWTSGDSRGGGPPPRGGRGRGGAFGTRGGGRKGFNSGGNGGQTRWDYGGDGYADMDANDTDAIVLGEHTNDVHSSSSAGWAAQDVHHEQVAQAGTGPGEEGDGRMGMGSLGATGATGGRMQKVGDNWVFVRNDGSSS